VGCQQDEASQRTPDALVVRTVPIDDPGNLLPYLPHPAALAWIRRGYGLVGWGVAARVTLPAGADRFTAGEKWLRELFDAAQVTDEVAVPGSGPVAFGSFTFDPISDGSVLVIPSAVLGRTADRAWLTTITDGTRPISPAVPVTAPGGVVWSDGSLTAPQWEQAVASAVASIRAGRLGKVVLARDLRAATSHDIDARALLGRLATSYPDCYTFSCAGLVGATPELLIQRKGEQVRSLVLAGTTPRGGTPATDDALGATLLASAKNVEEHEYAVDGVRAALQPLCDDLDVDPQPSLLRLANVQHLATRVTGRLAAAAGSGAVPSALALAAALHPTAAICGAPAQEALEMIRELERMDRGRYSGPVGWVDARGNGAWGIALRCAELDGATARLFAGCGIVADSDPAAELAETETKFRPMQNALEG
jgi:menaquinone-specific isochorismate synthase